MAEGEFSIMHHTASLILILTNHSSFSSFLVNEIIGRDMSQISVSQAPDISREAPLPGSECPDIGRSDGL
jgi:hypothetical protein